jgi:hypothetical protein
LFVKGIIANPRTNTYPLVGPISSDKDARTLLREAVVSGNPTVLKTLAGLHGPLDPEETAAEKKLNTLALKYLACTTGADCSSLGDPVTVNCSSSGECTNVPSYLMQSVNNDITPVIRRADEISAALKNREWTKVPGLGT